MTFRILYSILKYVQQNIIVTSKWIKNSFIFYSLFNIVSEKNDDR